MTLPCNPLDYVKEAFDQEARRRSVEGILESYHSNYDVLSEGVQNAVDAVEDAALEDAALKKREDVALKKPARPYRVDVTVSLEGNWISILDSGVGMTEEQVSHAFAPQATFKQQSSRGRKNMYRGYKGVGLTFLAYGTDDITIHSKKEGAALIKARMKYGRAWARGERTDEPVMNVDPDASPLESIERGTYVKVQFSNKTRPKSLSKIGSTIEIWNVILRTKTAIGQVLLGRDPEVAFKVKLKLMNGGETEINVEPTFLYPHNVKRTPPFRFLDLVDYHKTYAEQTTPPVEKLRQDGVYLVWDSARIAQELTDVQGKEYADLIAAYTPSVYAFVPYQGSVWGELNKIEAGASGRKYIYPGLMIAVNRQRLADISGIEATRFEVFGRNVFVAVHFDGVKPDQGRKTIEIEAEDFAKDAADRLVQYLGKQRSLLRPSGEAPTPEQREIERNHSEWLYNVQKHAETSPLHIPPATYVSTPLTEQDVIGLFHQLCSLGVFPGIKVYATSQSKTYDCLIQFDCGVEEPGLVYESAEKHPLGVSHFILGKDKTFKTRQLTLEFKNNLDRLIEDVVGASPKNFAHIDVCVCWGKVGDSFTGYELEPVTEAKLDVLRSYPGITHVLTRDGDTHVMS